MKTWPRWIVLGVVVAFAVVGCGGGGGGNGGGTDVTAPDVSRVGTYQLIGFTVTPDQGDPVTEKDVKSFKGTMKLGASSLSQTVTIEDSPALSANGTYTLSYTNQPVAGTFHFTDGTTGEQRDIDFSITNYKLTTTTRNDVAGFWENDVWRKVSDSAARQAPLEAPVSGEPGGAGTLAGEALY